MTWVKDYNETLVNIDRWDILYFFCIMDNKTQKPAALQVNLERGSEEKIMGWASVDDNGEQIIEGMSKGVSTYLSSLDSILYRYLNKCAELKDEADNNSWNNATYAENMAQVESLIGTRFTEYSYEE